MTHANLPDFASDLGRALESLGAGRVDTPVIQPAEPFLDMAGEDLRRRIFLTESETGESLCLRPEFTIPVCRAHIAEGVATPRRYCYLGQVFRQRRDGSNEFYQAGIEDLGETDLARADARAIAEAHTLLSALVNASLSTIVGDQAVFEAVVAGLGLPVGWQKRLIHAFGNQQALDAMIARLAAPQSATATDPDIAALLQAGDADRLASHITEVMEATGYSTHASRTPAEIARRLVEKRQLEEIRLSDAALSALRSFLALEAPLADAEAALSDFAESAGLDIAQACWAFGARVEALKAVGADLGSMTWRAAFGRPLDYYTGLVFEIAAGEGGPVLAGGGRFDRMMELLGARDPIPAVGFSLWLDRIQAARSRP
ncbi:ATP phosphoribosyltransferase regulatory subunit [Hoeflea marina]|uniref:ATP phosphoribosyltransferase regulatory subunit n=1 Tax=Hoeflea marina TaxID=274592 RepID=A0A317PPT2_9HYPH|nr:ATP phosphoribosyltransferase regulatory subunit [Hoeflea marina]PWW01590.1 ATP phosphoribosyltransferase regulatory subunit [Hoeflea marina]